jgi:protein-L-isoaspartate(D-aspartate) O-methyltransferase
MSKSGSQGRDSESSEIPPDDVSFELGVAHLSRREERLQMVSDTIRARGVDSARVLGALANVPRHAFVPSHMQSLSYSDRPLPIGAGQTISQPYIVALMTSLADLDIGQRCLEIGTGSGYQTAILAEMGAAVFTIEIRPDLARNAKARLIALGYRHSQIQFKSADGQLGWPEVAPFDAIVVTAAPDRLPPILLEQLAINGRLVVPIGPPDGVQRLERWIRRAAHNDPSAFECTTILNVQFVPLQSST